MFCDGFVVETEKANEGTESIYIFQQAIGMNEELFFVRTLSAKRNGEEGLALSACVIRLRHV